MSDETELDQSQFGRRLTLIITNLIKLAGLVIAVVEVVRNPDHPPFVALALSAFMMAGAQFSEETLIGIAERMFGGHIERRDKEDEP